MEAITIQTYTTLKSETLLHLQPPHAAMGIHTQPPPVSERHQQGPQLLLPVVLISAVGGGWVCMVMEPEDWTI